MPWVAFLFIALVVSIQCCLVKILSLKNAKLIFAIDQDRYSWIPYGTPIATKLSQRFIQYFFCRLSWLWSDISGQRLWGWIEMHRWSRPWWIAIIAIDFHRECFVAAAQQGRCVCPHEALLHPPNILPCRICCFCTGINTLWNRQSRRRQGCSRHRQRPRGDEPFA